MVGTSSWAASCATPFGLDRDIWLLLLSLPVVFYASAIFFTGAWAALKARTLDMMVLVAVAIGVAWLYSVAVDVLHLRRRLLRGRRDARQLRAARPLVRDARPRRRQRRHPRAPGSAPPKATVLRDGEPVEIPTAEVRSVICCSIRPGDKIAVDAEVVEAARQVDESTVTGESLPVSKKPGDELVGATINKNGTLRARATAVGSDTALAQIVALVQEAQNSKAPASGSPTALRSGWCSSRSPAAS